MRLGNLQSKLLKGLLPSPAAEWPGEPFRSAFLASLNKMEMPRFTRHHPQLLDPLLKQMLTLIHVRSLPLIHTPSSPSKRHTLTFNKPQCLSLCWESPVCTPLLCPSLKITNAPCMRQSFRPQHSLGPCTLSVASGDSPAQDFEAKMEELEKEQQNQEQQQQSQSQMQPQQGERSEEQQDSQGPADGAEPDWEV